MSVLSFSRISLNKNEFLVEVEFDNKSSSNGLKIKHYYDIGDGNIGSAFFNLNYNGNNKYSYFVNSNIVEDLFDTFELFENEIKLFTFGDIDNENPDFFISKKFSGMPSGEIEHRVLGKRVVNFWAHYTFYPWNYNPLYDISLRTFEVANIVPSALNADLLRTTVPDDRDFKNAFNPISTTRDAFNNLLEDAEELFMGENGSVFIIEEEDKVVIPFSNFYETYFEEYDFDDFYDVSMSHRGTAWQSGGLFDDTKLFGITLYPELTEVGKTNFSKFAPIDFYYDYKLGPEDFKPFPEIFEEGILALEKEFEKTSVEFSLMRFGNGETFDFQVNLGGAIYSSKNDYKDIL